MRVCQNLAEGSWAVEVEDYHSFSDGETVTPTLTIDEGYDVIVFRVKRYDDETYRLFEEYAYSEILEVRLRVSNPTHDWIELEIVRLHPRKPISDEAP